MAIKVGINGFGRIGRMVFRAAVENFANDIKIVGINDLLDPDYLAYMLKYDSVHGRFDGDIKVEGNFLVVNGEKIRITAEKILPTSSGTKLTPMSLWNPQASSSQKNSLPLTSKPAPKKSSCPLPPRMRPRCLFTA